MQDSAPPSVPRSRNGSRGSTRTLIAGACLVGLGAAVWRLYAAPYGPCLFCPGALPIFTATLATAYCCSWGLYLASGADGLRNRVSNLLLATGSAVMLIALLELPAALGLLDYRQIIVPRQDALFEIRPWLHPQNRLDPELLHVHQAHSHFSGTSMGDLVAWYGIPTDHRYPVDVRYDQYGFRNPTDLEKATVALIGDSFVESPMTAQDRLLSSELQRLLRAPVANFGQAGYGPPQELVVLRRYALPLQPRVVLWLFFEGNDLEDFNRYLRIRNDWDQHEKTLESFASRSFTRSMLLGLASRMPRPRSQLWRKRGCAYRRGRPDAGLPLYFAFGDSPHLAADTAFRDGSALPRVAEVISEAARITTAAGARFVFVYVPIKFRVYQAFAECGADSDIAHWRLADMPGHFERWCSNHGIPFLDLTPALRHAASEGELVFYPDDDHWNEQGQKIAADEIVAFLAQQQSLGSPQQAHIANAP